MGEEISMSKLAEELGLSPTTVSRALSGKGRISTATIQKVEAYLKENQLIPRSRSNTYKNRGTGNILVALPGEKDYIQMPYFMEILSSIYDAFSIRDFNIMIVKISATDISELEKIVSNHQVDGVILSRTIENGIDIDYLRSKGIPFVAIGGCKDKSVPHVDANQIDGCKDLTSVLLNMGMRNAALLCADPTHIVTQERLKGFLLAYEEQGQIFDSTMLYEGMGDYTAVEQVISDILNRKTDYIICMDDNICINVLNLLRKNHIQVPEDIKVASFYNSRLLDGYYPSVSCVSFNSHELGRAASNMLYDILNDKVAENRVISDYTIMLKEST